MEKLFTVSKLLFMVALMLVHGILTLFGLSKGRLSDNNCFLHSYFCFGYHKRLGLRMIRRGHDYIAHYIHCIWFSYKIELNRSES